MTYAICALSAVPVRNSSSHSSEMISQLLFGELAEVLDSKGRQWLKVRCQSDNFVGWVDAHQLKAVTQAEFDLYQTDYAYILDFFHPAMAAQHVLPLTIGCHLPCFDGLRLQFCGETYTFSGQAVMPSHIKPDAAFLLKVARRYLNAPYLWGGRSPMGIDAPGLVQVVFKMAGFRLPREAEEQVFMGEQIDFVEQALPGDLAFFENQAGRISHVGIVLPDRQVIHAYGQVRIDKLDHFGIFNAEQRRYTHRMRVIKRLLPPAAAAAAPGSASAVPVSEQFELF